MLAGIGLDPHTQYHGAVTKGLHAEPFQLSHDAIGDLWLVLHHAVEGVEHGLLGLFDILAVGDAHVTDRVGEAAHIVADHINGREGDHVECALHIAQRDRAHRQLFDGTSGAAHGDHIAHVDDVLELDEHTGDDVLHHLLRAETNRQTQDPGRGKQWPDIQPDLAQHEHQREDDQRNGRRIAQQGKQGGFPRGWHSPVFRVQLVVDKGCQREPDAEGHRQDQPDRDQRLGHRQPDLPFKPAAHVDRADYVQRKEQHADQQKQPQGAEGAGDKGVDATFQQRQLGVHVLGQ